MTIFPSSSSAAGILVVDDVAENIGFLSRLLTQRGYTVRQALDGEQALHSARQKPPDLILLDINMPGLSGYEVAIQLKQDSRLADIPIIFLSALEDSGDKVRAFSAGGVDYVTKPFQFDEVEARIATHLKIHRLQVELADSNRQYEKANAELHRHEQLRDDLRAATKLGMWWTYYKQFDCQMVEPECRKSTLDFLYVFDRFAERNPSILASFTNRHLDKTVERLREWANDSSKAVPLDGPLSLTSVLLFLTVFRSHIERQLTPDSENTDQMVHPDVADKLERYLKWRGHFPRLKSRVDPDEIMERASRSTTIVVVGDIRRSQDLMTYAVDDQDFSTRMVEFISTTRLVLDKYGGFFDKFTGDGFIGYFNESICEMYDSNYIDSFIGFVREFTAFSNAHFREWVRFVRKIPAQTVGLAVGADLGRVSFQSLNFHVVAVSESIVWASRMASAAGAEEVLLNNLLYQALRKRTDLVFESREAGTKSGESFQAWKLKIKGIDPDIHNSPEDVTRPSFVGDT